MRSLRERCLGGISDSRREKEKENRQAERAVANKVASNPFEKVALAGRPIWPAKIRIPTSRQIGEKAKERRERKEKRSSNIPMMETKVIHPMTMAKEKADKKKEHPRCSQPSQRRRSSSPPHSQLHHPQSQHMPVGQIRIGIHPGIGVNKAGTHAMSHPALDKRRWRSMTQHEKDAIHEKLIQANAVSEQSMAATAKQSLLTTKLMAPVINPQHNPTYTRSMGSWHAIKPMKSLISYEAM